MEKIKEYQSGDLTVIWKPALCMHSERCWRGLPEVFKPRDKPWIQPDNVDNQRIINQIDQCPSGALSYRLAGQKDQDSGSHYQIKVSKDGPYLIHENVSIELPDGSVERREKAVALCRCGGSANKPYCDGSHKKTGFKG